MGSITSKQNPEVQKNVKNSSTDLSQNLTPKSLKTLPFDPRSPSENINRTPITITDSSEGNGTPNIRKLKALPLDPRSPTTEVTRTPLYVEENGDKKKYLPTKPSKLTDISFNNNPQICEKDPRSPTEKVPRTPLEEENVINCKTGEPLFGEEIKTTPSNQRDSTVDPKVNLNKKLFETLEKDRKPLMNVQNQPKNQIQALQCRNVEEEFTKNEKLILNKLENSEQSIKTSTDFIESI